MRKRFLAIIMVCMLGVSMSACGSSNEVENTAKSEVSPEASETEKTEESVVEGTAEPSANSESVEESESTPVEVINPFAELEKDYSVQLPIYVVSHYSINSSSSKSETNYYFANHVFDDEGRLISYEKSENEKRWDSFTNEYDEQGHVVKLIQDNANSSLSDVTEYEYDEAGNCIKATTTEVEDPTDVNTNTYEYDENGLVVKSVNEQSGSITEYNYELDDSGKVIKVSRYRDGVLKTENEYEYDAANRLSKDIETSFNDDGSKKSVYEQEVEMDPYGHIVQADAKQTYSDEGKNFTQDRKIYYEIGGYKTINSADRSEIASTDEWSAISEDVAIPALDSVVPGFCSRTEADGENEYKYTLNVGEFDIDCYDYINRCYTDRLANTAQTTPNETFWIYTGALKEVLGYEVDELDNGKYVVSIDGFPAAELQYEYAEGNYYLTITLS